MLIIYPRYIRVTTSFLLRSDLEPQVLTSPTKVGLSIQPSLSEAIGPRELMHSQAHNGFEEEGTKLIDYNDGDFMHPPKDYSRNIH